jgi:hypothetical protein
MCAPDCASHARPWLLEGQNTFNIIPMNLLSRDWVDDRGFDTEERKRSTARLGGSNTGERSDNVGARLGLPVCLESGKHFLTEEKYISAYVNDMSFLLSNNLKVPLPDFGSDWFSNGS